MVMEVEIGWRILFFIINELIRYKLRILKVLENLEVNGNLI